VNGIAGRREAALQDLAQLEQQQAQGRFVTAYGVALVYAALGERDRAFHWLEKAFEERSHWLVWLRLDPRWEPLRSDARFEGLVRRLRFPA
jgi:hypothetical protein